MKRHPLALMIVLFMTVLAFAGTAGAANVRAAVTDGLLLIGTDAAYARFVAPIDACHSLDLFVGYVEADGLKSPIRGGRPVLHSDVDVFLTVYENAETEGCGTSSLQLAGTQGVTDSDHAEIVTLVSATLDGFELTVTGDEGQDPVMVVLTLDLTWTGDGDVYTETTHEAGDHSAHRTVAAAVEGTLTIESVTGGGRLAAALSALVGQGPVDTLDQTEGVITRYRQIIINLP